MELSIAKLAVPRKQAIIHKTADYDITKTAVQYSRISGDMQLRPPLTPQPDAIKYYPRLYKGSPPSGYDPGNVIAYAEVYANANDTKKARICYSLEPRYNETIQMNELWIHCHIMDEDLNETSFWINPGYYLRTGLICNNIDFLRWRYKPWYQGTKIDLEDSEVHGSGIAPYLRRTRTADNENFEVALAAQMFDMTVEIGVYNYSTQTQLDDQIVSGIDSDSNMGRGGLYSYQVCAGVTDKNAAMAAIDPSGEWYMEDITRYEQDISVSWE